VDKKKAAESQAEELRRQAEARLRFEEPLPEAISPAEAKKLIHELRVHQIELEMQNDELRQAQEILEESRSRYSDLYDFAPIGYLILDELGIIKEANLTAARLLAVERTRLIDRQLTHFLVTEDRGAFRRHLNLVLKGRERQTVELRLKREDGKEIFILLESIFHQDTEGRSLVRTAFSDITKRKKDEKALKQAHDELEQRVKDRTAALQSIVAQLQKEVTNHLQTGEALKKSEKRLRHLSSQLLTAQEDERKRLAAELHDELGHALLTIKLQLRALERGLTLEQKKLAEDIEALQPFIDGVLDSVRRLYFDLSPGNLEDLGLSGALRQILGEFAKNHPDIRWEVKLDNVDADFSLPTQTVIYRIVQETLTNIGKHAKPSRVSVRVKRNPTAALFTVEDNGCGFDTSQIYSVDAPNRRLGLLAMEEQVRIQGGTLEIISRANQGTRITFTLPLGSGRE
jgi:PAS domain S-box-containing protein